MSVFGLIKKGRQAAKEHKAVQAEKQKAEEQKPSYRHVPTHAAVDALSGAPSSWRHEDRPRILEQNRRRSAMAASGHGSMGTPLGQNPVHAGMPRVNSALSHVSYPSLHANPMVALPRTYSYHGGMQTPWGERPAEVVYSQPDMLQVTLPAASALAVNGKGKGVDRPAGSRASSKAPSPVGSSGDSASSQDELEMKPARHHRPSASVTSQTSEDARTGGPVHRLHPSQRARRPSDPPLPTADRHPSASTDKYPPAAMDRYFQPRTGTYRPAVSRTGSSPMIIPTSAPGIPPVPSLPPMSFGPSIASSTPSSSSAAPSIRSNKAGSSHSPPTPVARPESPVSPISPVSLASPASQPQTASASRSPITPPSASSQARFDFNFATSAPPLGVSPPKVPPEAAITPAPAARVFHLKQASRASQQPSRMLDFEPVTFHPEQFRPASMSAAPISSRSMARSSVAASQLPIDFDEGALASIQESVATVPPSALATDPATQKASKGKLSKVSSPGAKLSKKNRWSFKSKPTPVAG